MASLIHCIYASAASASFSESDLPLLLEKSRAANLRRGVTGMLLYIDGSFFQVLEGAAADVDTVYRAIDSDKRHERISLIIREPIVDRGFGEWTMGFSNLAAADAGRILGENDFFTGGTCLTHLTNGRARKLLAAFGSGRWRADRTGKHKAHARFG